MADQQAYLAKPSGACCRAGHLHAGEPRGATEPVAGLDTYISRPAPGAANGHVVLYFPDVWGFFANAFLVMDAFAEAGYVAAGADYFRGDPVWKHRRERDDTTTEPGFDFASWCDDKMAFAVGAVPAWVAAVTAKLGGPGTKFACVGYCFGAPFVCDELAKETCTVGAFAHPAFLKDHHIQNIQKPLFLSCSEVDHMFEADARRKTIDMLIEGKKDYALQLFAKVEHGFALRGNPNDPYECWVKEQSLKGIVDWFDFWLAK